MKAHLIACLAGILPATLVAQTYDGSGFFDPSFTVRTAGGTSAVSVQVTNTVVSSTQSTTPAKTTWTHSAGGLVQTRADINVVVPVATVDIQLRAKTETTGNSLVFGREITTDVNLLGGAVDLSGTVSGLLNGVVGASGIDYSWQSQASVSGLAIAPDQLYRVSFDVTSGAGLAAGILNSASFGITNASVTGASSQSAQLLNLLDLVAIGDGADGTYTFDFKSSTALTQLDFAFAARTGLVDANLLGGAADNQNVLTFSNLQVAQIPEPSALLLSCMGGLLVFRRRR